MTITSRDRIQIVYREAIAPGIDVQSSTVIPSGQIWHVTRIIFADHSVNDGISGGFQVDFGSGGSRDIVLAGYLTGNTIAIDINRSFTGDGSAVFRYIRENNSATDKKMFLMAEGFKRIGD